MPKEGGVVGTSHERVNSTPVVTQKMNRDLVRVRRPPLRTLNAVDKAIAQAEQTTRNPATMKALACLLVAVSRVEMTA